MHSEITSKAALRIKRAHRVRSKIHGTRHKPRLSVFKSNKHISAQLIDDEAGVTIAHVSTYSKEKRSTPHGKKSKEAAEVLGREIAEQAHKHQIKELVFDRGSYKYHGVLVSLADAVRAAGIHF